MPSMVVLGNGPQAIEHKLGHRIDQFDWVIRINRWQTEQFESFVGTKTTHWAINCQPNVRSKMRERAAEGFLVDNVFRVSSMGEGKRRTTDKVVKECFPDAALTVIEPSYGETLRGNMGYWPSTGLLVLYYLIQTTIEPIYVHGFNLATDGQKGHYFAEGGSGIHKPKQELKLMGFFKKAGRIKVLAHE